MLFLKFFFKRWSLQKQAAFIKTKGMMLASRKKDSRLIYIYMYKNLFAEVKYKDDDPEKEPESLLLLNGLDKLNQHLEKETKSVLE